MSRYIITADGEGYMWDGESPVPEGAKLYDMSEENGLVEVNPGLATDPNLAYGDPGSLGYQLATEGGMGTYGGFDHAGFSNPDSVGAFLQKYVPQGYDLTPAIQDAWQQQQSQFGSWSGADDPGQTALKILAQVDEPWAQQATQQIQSSPEFAQSQYSGTAALNYNPDAGTFYGVPGPIASAALGAILGPMGFNLNSAFGGGILGGAGTGALSSAIMGGDPIMGAITGSLAPGMSELGVPSQYIPMASSLTGAAISGGDLSNALLNGLGGTLSSLPSYTYSAEDTNYPSVFDETDAGMAQALANPYLSPEMFQAAPIAPQPSFTSTVVPDEPSGNEWAWAGGDTLQTPDISQGYYYSEEAGRALPVGYVFNAATGVVEPWQDPEALPQEQADFPIYQQPTAFPQEQADFPIQQQETGSPMDYSYFNNDYDPDAFSPDYSGAFTGGANDDAALGALFQANGGEIPQGTGLLGNIYETASGGAPAGLGSLITSAIKSLFGGGGSATWNPATNSWTGGGSSINPMLAMLAGGLLGGMSGNSKPAGNTTVTQDVPDWQKPYITGMLDSAKNVYQAAENNNGFLTNGRNTLNSAIQGDFLNSNPANAAYGAAAGYNNPYEGLLAPTATGAFLNSNPYLDATYDRAARAMTDQYKYATMPNLSKQFGHMQAFGGNSGFQQATGLAQRGLATGLGDLATGIYGNNYANERGMMQNAQTGLLGSANATQGIRLNGAGGLGQNFNTARSQQLSAATTAPGYANDMTSNMFAPINNYSNLVGRSFGSQTQQPYFSNPTGGALSGALGGLALSNLFKG